MSRAGLTGHAAALLTIFFISTKVLLTGLRPVEVLFLRFALGFAALCLLYPRRLRLAGRRQELWFAAAGLCGVTLYFLLENIALTCTLASNVGVLVSVSPMLTALLSHFLLRRERLRPLFFAGLAVALAGVAMVSYNGAAVLEHRVPHDGQAPAVPLPGACCSCCPSCRCWASGPGSGL